MADEVGLGKTLVARGVIAKAIDHLWGRVPRIDIVYICSSAEIARQNINRLNVTGQEDLPLASRITLLPITLRDLKTNSVNFVSFTPGTSFSLKSNLGTAEERALLYWLLSEAWDLRGTGPLNVLRGHVQTGNFRDRVRYFRDSREIDKSLAEEFVLAVGRQIASDQQKGQPDLRSRFDDLCTRFSKDKKNIPQEDATDRSRLIGELRSLLAATCLQALQPDLIILDEFQRFKHLLDGDDEASQLARRLFEYADDVSTARVLLLSATPYRMYTTSSEMSEDDHYNDFVRTLGFLLGDETKKAALAGLLKEYRRELFRLDGGGTGRLVELKHQLEFHLRSVMLRTERLAASEDRNGMLVEAPMLGVTLEPQDLEAFVALQRVARLLETNGTLEYWKSAPYLLNFMDNYDLKRALKEAVGDPNEHSALEAALSGAGSLLLPWPAIRAYGEIDPGNARLRGMLTETVRNGAWRLLWIPPSLPYYRLGGPFDDQVLERFTKRLVFSSWLVAPKVIAAILSYESERLMMTSGADTVLENTVEARRRRSPLLRFARDSEGRLTGMPVLGLIYPSMALGRLGDPLEFFRERGADGAAPLISEMLKWVGSRLEGLLPAIGATLGGTGPVDETWYWAAPILLDVLTEPAAARRWLSQGNLDWIWSSAGESRRDQSEDTIWAEHVKRARDLVADRPPLGRPPDDLVSVLAEMALAGPAVAAMRALARIAGGPARFPEDWLRNHAGQVAWAFRSLFNLPEVMALIRGMNPEEPYWRRVLDYCVNGGLQATLDEFAHMLREMLGLFDKKPDEVSAAVSGAMDFALGLRASTTRVDEIVVNNDSHAIAIEDQGMRARFAMRFGDDDADGGAEVTRKDQVRAAFNSPFWPFVVATTSIGQEGLDFHPYCHAVVHWNLPSNPVDLEQREGRIHRYKGHAVRRNLALRYGASALSTGCNDPWDSAFEQGSRDRAEGVSDLVPFWVYQIDGGAKIERHVPALAMSRDLNRLAALRRALTLYRMVFGQPRQEDLLAYLTSRSPEPEVARALSNLRIDLSPPEI
ncbi:MAG TPA: helicase-related protein [bacterium]|nr:helicase-related protein [bacterium]